MPSKLVRTNSTWSVADKKKLFQLLQKYPLDAYDVLSRGLKTKTEEQVEAYIKRVQNSIPHSTGENKLPIEIWSDVAGFLLEQEPVDLSAQLAQVMSIVGNFEEFPQSSDTQPDFASIYHYFASLLAGQEPKMPGPLESAVILDLLNSMTSVLANCQTSVQRTVLKWKYDLLQPKENEEECFRRFIENDFTGMAADISQNENSHTYVSLGVRETPTVTVQKLKNAQRKRKGYQQYERDECFIEKGTKRQKREELFMVVPKNVQKENFTDQEATKLKTLTGANNVPSVVPKKNTAKITATVSSPGSSNQQPIILPVLGSSATKNVKPMHTIVNQDAAAKIAGGKPVRYLVVQQMPSEDGSKKLYKVISHLNQGAYLKSAKSGSFVEKSANDCTVSPARETEKHKKSDGNREQGNKANQPEESASGVDKQNTLTSKENEQCTKRKETFDTPLPGLCDQSNSSNSKVSSVEDDQDNQMDSTLSTPLSGPEVSVNMEKSSLNEESTDVESGEKEQNPSLVTDAETNSQTHSTLDIPVPGPNHEGKVNGTTACEIGDVKQQSEDTSFTPVPGPSHQSNGPASCVTIETIQEEGSSQVSTDTVAISEKKNPYSLKHTPRKYTKQPGRKTTAVRNEEMKEAAKRAIKKPKLYSLNPFCIPVSMLGLD